MIPERAVDLVVVGSGPGGEGAAMQAAKAGRETIVVESWDRVGGGCTHWNTIPSKALRFAIFEVMSLSRSPLFSELLAGRKVSFPDLARTSERVVTAQADMRRAFYERNRVDVIHGHARFVEPGVVEVERPDDAPLRLRAADFVLATGSRPYHPPELDFSHPRIIDSDTILRLDFTPRVALVYGAGVVGCEYACMLRNLGVKVNLINTRSRLLSFLDDEIVDALAYHLRDQGVLIRHDEVCTEVEPFDDGVVVHLASGKKMRGDVLLWANGRTGNTNDLGLEALGLTPDGRGNLAVDRHYRTSVPHVYAVGDIAGPPALASAAYDEGRFAASHIVEPKAHHRLVEHMPVGIYTSPEISCVGRTERELTEAGVPYEVGHSSFAQLARAQITGRTVGMLKLLFHRETLALLGVHCFGYQAAEIVHIGQAVLAQQGAGNTLEYFANTTFNYPTMAEAYRVAALNGLNRLW